MAIPPDKARAFLTSGFEASVSAQIGSWADGIADRVLGQGTYLYRDGDVELILYDGGLGYTRGDVRVSIPYNAITKFDTLTLRELLALQYGTSDPTPPIDRLTDLRLHVGAIVHRLRVPLKVYSSIHSPLLRILEWSGPS